MHRTEGENAVLDLNGHRIYTEGPPPTTITAASLNALQEEICHVIEQAGFTLKTAQTDTHTQLYEAIATLGNPYDYVVYSNPTFLDAIERVAANQYKFKDNIESIHFKSSEYSMSYVLSGGDTWGYLETNQCKYIDFEMGAYINMGNERGYIEANTEGCLLQNVSIRGLGTVASAIARSYLLNASYVTFNNCDSQIRLTNTDCIVFEGSGTSLHNDTSVYNGCKVINFTSSSGNLNIMKDTKNVSNFIIYDIESTSGSAFDNIFIMENCYNCNNITVKKIDHSGSGDIVGIKNCYNVSNIYIEDVDGNDDFFGISLSYFLSNIYIIDIDMGDSCFGIYSGGNFTNVYVADMTGVVCYGFYSPGLLWGLNNCKAIQLDATGNCYGFYNCANLSSCYAEDIDSSGGNYHGFYQCNQLSSCYATDCEDGFNTCKQVTGCQAEANDNDGFNDCNNIAGSRATSNGNDGYNTCTCISACRANTNTGNGYNGCNTMTANRAAGNTAAQYNNSFADLAGLNACADTSLGGYNG
jgi:hypothetical protein